MNPLFLRSSGVFNAYISTKKIKTDASAYSISFVADNAMRNNEMNLTDLFWNIDFSRSGIVIALPEKRP